MSFYIAGIVILLVLSAFFSGSETALFSLGKVELGKFSESRKRRQLKIVKLMKYPQKILITILLGNLLVNILFSQIMTKLFMERFGKNGHLIALAVITPLIIIFCEITPKVIAINKSEKVSLLVMDILSFIHLILAPIRFIFLFLTNILIKILRLDPVDDQQITEKEIDRAVDMWEKNGVILPEERTFIKNVLRFSKKTAENVMIPRTEAIGIPDSSTIDNAIKIMHEKNVIRAVVYSKDMDNITGGIDFRDLLEHHVGMKRESSIKKFIFPVPHYPETIDLSLLLDDFLKNKITMAVVVDEYGGTSGIVTLSSMLTQLLGNEFSTSSEKKRQVIRKLDDEIVIIPGDMQIDDFNDRFNDDIETTEAETIAGFVTEELGHMPMKGEIVSTVNCEIKIRYIRKNRIESLEIRKLLK
ncbi:MAG: HlyC/CorC family transporter [Spirochaetes bacterium]|nr:HlyC/CorC family transporter [Spirochaetota bacterium]